MAKQDIHITVDDGAGLLTLDRPPANALDLGFAERLDDALAGLAEDESLRSLTITGTGGMFCAGLDLKVVPGYDAAEQAALIMAINRMYGRLYGFPVPTVAAVNGHAIAGGLILALACDGRVAVDANCLVGLTEVRVGVPFPVAPREIVRAELSPQAARRMILTGRNLDSGAAVALGILDETCARERLAARGAEIAADMASAPRASFTKLKRQLREKALARIAEAVERRAEPMLAPWLDESNAQSARAILDEAGTAQP